MLVTVGMKGLTALSMASPRGSECNGNGHARGLARPVADDAAGRGDSGHRRPPASAAPPPLTGAAGGSSDPPADGRRPCARFCFDLPGHVGRRGVVGVVLFELLHAALEDAFERSRVDWPDEDGQVRAIGRDVRAPDRECEFRLSALLNGQRHLLAVAGPFREAAAGELFPRSRVVAENQASRAQRALVARHAHRPRAVVVAVIDLLGACAPAADTLARQSSANHARDIGIFRRSVVGSGRLGTRRSGGATCRRAGGRVRSGMNHRRA